jgi:dGTPase
MRMDWNKLLSTKRVSDFCSLSNPNESQFRDPRSAFEKDCDQIIYSYPFRRLQDKTQVIPFPKHDFVHTRLTHSLEVSTIGRSLGKLSFDLIKNELKSQEITASDLGALVAGACFAHDIGNPPFGHSGEDSISIYFDPSPQEAGLYFSDGYYMYDYENTQYLIAGSGNYPIEGGNLNELNKIKTLHNSKMYYDLKKFEGNANGFRILTTNCGKGINPTFALLGTFSKYPRESFILEDCNYSYKRKEAPKYLYKYGFFQTEKEIFQDIANELGLIKISKNQYDLAYSRHPLTYLMEAADDIAYQMIDFEDGCRLDLIHYHQMYEKNTPKEILIKIAQVDERFSRDHLELLCKEGDHTNELSYLRSGVINTLIHLCFNVFEKNYDSIMKGEFQGSLINEIDNKEVQDSLAYMRKLIENHVYNYRPVLGSEAAGFEILEGLIYSFANTAKICVSCGDRKNAKEEKIESLIPKDYRPKTEAMPGTIQPSEIYERYVKIIDYISGMTDSYALDLYRQIKGITFNSY